MEHNYLGCDFFQWFGGHLLNEMRNEGWNEREKERKERKEGRKKGKKEGGEKKHEQEEESKTNGKSIMGHKRRAKCSRTEKQNRDNTVSENTA